MAAQVEPVVIGTARLADAALLPDVDGFLYAEDGCPLAELLRLLDALGDPSVPSAAAIALAKGLPAEPKPRELDALRGWRNGLATVLHAHRTLFRLDEHHGCRLAAAGFVPIEPVLRGWHDDLGLEPANCAGAAWLNRLDWLKLLQRARRRDLAAREIIAGRAALADGDIVALPAPGRRGR